jgi:hypothetical protein
LILPVIASSSVSDHQENNQQREKYIKELEGQIEQKAQSINTLLEEKQNLNKLLEDALEQTIDTQHLVEVRQILWDQIISIMDQFRFHLEIYQYCETMTIKNAQLDISNHLPDIEKKIPQAERIIEFMNSLSDQDLKDLGVKDNLKQYSNVKNVIEKGNCLNLWLRRLKKFINQSLNSRDNSKRSESWFSISLGN